MQDNVQDIERADEETASSSGSTMIEEGDVEVEDRLEAEDDQFQAEMEKEPEDSTEE